MIIKNAKTLGTLAVEKGLLSEPELEECVQAQKTIAQVGCQKRLGQILMEKGMLSSQQLMSLLKVQKTRYQERYFADYQLHATLGQGGMGTVYWATRLRDGLRVALKILSREKTERPESVERFLRESRMAMKLKHPNLVRAHDVGCAEGRYYIALEFVRGWSLSHQLIEKGAMQQAKAILVTRQVARALAYLANHGIVHRDVKPGNIMICAHNQAKLLDYGLAREMGVAMRRKPITVTGQIVGTPDYMAPEQIMGEPIDERTDIYALGATLYSMVTGHAPFSRYESQNAVLMAHLAGTFRDPLEIVPDLNPSLVHVIEKAMAIEPDDRYASLSLMIDDLDQVFAGRAPNSRRLRPSRTNLVVKNRRARGAGGFSWGDVPVWVALTAGLSLSGGFAALVKAMI